MPPGATDSYVVEDTGRDHIEGTVGDDGKQAAVGKDIEQVTNTNNVYVYPVSPEPRQRRTARRTGKLMPDEAKELRESIDHLRVTMTRLEGTVDKNNALTLRSMDALQEQIAIFKAQIAARAPVWIAYLTVTFLAVIAIVVTIATVYWIAQR